MIKKKTEKKEKLWNWFYSSLNRLLAPQKKKGEIGLDVKIADLINAPFNKLKIILEILHRKNFCLLHLEPGQKFFASSCVLSSG